MHGHTSKRNHYSVTGVWINYNNLTEKESPKVNNTLDGGQ
jgi:hypothetical protein